MLGLKTKRLPWTTLPKLLAGLGLELDKWPDQVPLPGSDHNKGINGLNQKQLCLLYDAMMDKAHPLGFRKITNNNAASGDAVASANCFSKFQIMAFGIDYSEIFILQNEMISEQLNASQKRTYDVNDFEGPSEKRPRNQ
jgi:hypothetical protein